MFLISLWRWIVYVSNRVASEKQFLSALIMLTRCVFWYLVHPFFFKWFVWVRKSPALRNISFLISFPSYIPQRCSISLNFLVLVHTIQMRGISWLAEYLLAFQDYASYSRNVRFTLCFPVTKLKKGGLESKITVPINQGQYFNRRIWRCAVSVSEVRNCPSQSPWWWSTGHSVKWFAIPDA
jgi:hypothetical protein